MQVVYYRYSVTYNYPEVTRLSSRHLFLKRARMTPAQLRAARGLLNWSRRDLAEKSGTSPEAVQWFEARGGDPKLSTTQKWRRALQAGGVEFFDADAQGGAGVRFILEAEKELAAAPARKKRPAL
jgi:transcriptional regulator with XRE-family HTH domain